MKSTITILLVVVFSFSLYSETGMEGPTKKVEVEINPKMPKNDKKIFKNIAKWYGTLRQMAMSSISTLESVQGLALSFQRHLNAALNVSKRVTLIVENAANFDGKNFIEKIVYLEENIFQQVDYLADYDIKELRESRANIGVAMKEMNTRGGEFKKKFHECATPVYNTAIAKTVSKSVNQRISRRKRKGQVPSGNDVGVDLAQRTGESAQMEHGARDFEGDISHEQIVTSIEKQTDSKGDLSVQSQSEVNKANSENAYKLLLREHDVYGTVVTSLSQALIQKAQSANGIVFQRNMLLYGVESFLTEYSKQSEDK
jgi:hypothetical protein